MVTYAVIFVVLLVCELAYFKVADKFNIIDKPNERSSHSTIVLRGGGIIFAIAMLLWFGYQLMINDLPIEDCYPWFVLGLILVAGVSFIDDIRSLPDSVRLVVQFTAAGLAFYELGMLSGEWFEANGVLMGGVLILLALIVYVGATNVINFMDGINGITGGYALAVLVPLMLVNANCTNGEFFDQSLVGVSILAVLVFCVFNFRPKGKAKCFAGDVGSIGIAFIMLFLIGKVIISTGDLTYLIFLIVYGADGILTICHRIMLHENLGEAHRKHAYQLMANELKIGHVKVSLLYMAMQGVVSLGFIYFCPPTVLAHWVYFLVAAVVLIVVYILFKKKYYHLHEEYLASLARK